MSGDNGNAVSRFSIITHYNSPNEGVTDQGKKVRREDKIYILNHWVKCAPYDTNFLYADPSIADIVGRWSPMCTCGSQGGIIGYDAYKKDASPSTAKESSIPGEMVVCFHHAKYGKHADGST